jgi:hypothetical protein
MEIGKIKRDLILKEFNSGFLEYQLVVWPGKLILEELDADKQRLFKKYEIHYPTSLQPHIVVNRFLAREKLEETIIGWIHRICCKQIGFQITLNNYSGFPPNTIFLRVPDIRPFQHVGSKLKVIEDFIAVFTSFINRCHLSIVSKLPEKIFEKALCHYSQKKFHESFTANELILLNNDRLASGSKPFNLFHLLPINKCI